MSDTANSKEQQQRRQLNTGAAIAPSEPPIAELPSESSRHSSSLGHVSVPSTPGLQEASNPLEDTIASVSVQPLGLTSLRSPSTGSLRRSASQVPSVGLNSTSRASQGQAASSNSAQEEGERNYIFSRLRAAPNVAVDATRLHRARARGQRKMSDSNLPPFGRGKSSMLRALDVSAAGKGNTYGADAQEGNEDEESLIDEAGHAILSRAFERKARQEAVSQRVEEAKRQGAKLGREAALVELRNAMMGFVGSNTASSEGDETTEQGGDALGAFQALMSSSTNNSNNNNEARHEEQPHHGKHPGLAGRRMVTRGAGGGVPARIAGGPGAPATLRQASSAGTALAASTAREQDSGAHADAELASKSSREPHAPQAAQQAAGGENHYQHHNKQPSMIGASRFPGGRVMSAQGSMGEQASRLRSTRDAKGQESSTLASSVAQRSDSNDSLGDDNDDANTHYGAPHHSGSPLARYRWRLREFLAELVASTLLLTIGLSVNCQVHLSQDLTRSPTESAGTFSSINFAWGFGVLCTIHVAGGISGAHANPAVTLSLAVFRGFPWKLVPVYIAAQLLGSFVGAAIAYGLYLPAIDAWEGRGVRSVVGDKATASLFVTIPTEQTTPLTAFFNEVVGSAVLAIMVFAVGDESNSPPGDGMSGLILGLTVTMIGMSLGWLSGYAINAARDLGPRIFLAMVGYPSSLWTHDQAWWIYGPIIGTLTGAVLGSTLYDLAIFQSYDSPLNRRWHRPRVHSMVRGLERGARNVGFGKHHKKEYEQEQQEEGGELRREEERAEKGGVIDTAANSTKQAVQRRWAEDATAESRQHKDS